MNRKETPKPPAQSLPESPAQPATEASASNLPKAYDPSAIEQRWAEYWVRERLFDVPTPKTGAEAGAPQLDSERRDSKRFTQLLPPPNVTGRLHMGHMLNQTEMDILTRWHRMSGQTSLWVPGTDHAGIATQIMVERQIATEGSSRQQLGRDAFTARVWEWKRQYGSAITDQMRRLGASVDWSREYFTMDDHLNVAVKEAFVRLYEQGLIYRGSYIVNWDPIQQTAVSDLEVTHEDRVDKLYHIRYPFADGTGSIVVATTRPETMLGDTAVAVNPADARYTAFIGKVISLPLSAVNGSPNREIPILADEWAQPEFGTGAVKVTPAHDPNDFAIGQRHALPSLTILDTTAHIDLSGSPYHGLDRFAARKRIVADMDALGLLVDIKDHNLAIAISQRSGAVIEPRLSMQWFLAVNKAPEGAGGFSPLNTPAQEAGFSPGGVARDSIAAKAIAAVRDGHIHFTPEMYSKTYFEWMTNIHDWCISRQLWWGHRIPAWHCAACRAITVARETPVACASCGSTQIAQETDVLDTWFSSGLLPFTVFGWPGTASLSSRSAAEGAASSLGLTADLAAFYPTSLLVTGFDILFFWVARMIMLGTHFMLDVPMPGGSTRKLAEAVPFKEVYIHALVRDADRQKMSKTKGNVIDPIEIIERFGTDAVRFTLASMASPGTDIAFSEARTEGNRAFANKIWNAARFLFMNLDRAREAGIEVTLPNPSEGVILSDPERAQRVEGDSKDPEGAGPVHTASSFSTSNPEATPLETRWILSRLNAVSAEVHRALSDYRFDEAASAIYQFFWGDLCDWYLEIVKLRLNFEPTNDLPFPTSEDAEDSVEQTRAALTTFVHVFESALRLLSPFMPFLTEEIWHALYVGLPPAKSIALAPYPQAADFPSDPAAEDAMNFLKKLIVSIRNLRKESEVPEKLLVPVFLFTRWQLISPPYTEDSKARYAEYLAQKETIAANHDMIMRLSRTESIAVSALPLSGLVRTLEHFDVKIIYERQIDVPAERVRLTKDLAKYEKGLAAAERQLSNASFMAKAPAHIVEGLRKQAAETRTLHDKTKAALDALPSDN